MSKRYLKTPEDVVDALHSGKIVTDGAYRYRLYKGIIVGNDGYNWDVSPVLDNDYNLYVDEPKPLKLEVGKFYKTRDGRKAWIVSRQQGSYYAYNIAVLGNTGVYTVKENGTFCDNGPSPEDLIAPWED